MEDEGSQDSVLIAAAIEGDLESFEVLYRRHSSRVYGLCVRLARNAADAQDCTQETFISAWRHLRTFRGQSSLATWLHRIAVNEVLGRKRRAAVEARHLEVVHADGDERADIPPDHGELEELEKVIRQLPERAREVFVLHRIYGYTHEETAEMLKIAVGTCKSQLHRASRLLIEALDHGGSKSQRKESAQAKLASPDD
jgi:RNA polymerase sigma-70 factor (ECF subfamily)